MIDLAVKDERIDCRHMIDPIISVGIGGGLQLLSVRLVRAVKALLRKDDSPRSPTVEYVFASQERNQHFQVFEGDSWGIISECGGFVSPCPALKEVFWIRMKGQVPVKITFRLCLAIEVFQKRPARKRLHRVSTRVTDIPVVLE